MFQQDLKQLLVAAHHLHDVDAREAEGALQSRSGGSQGVLDVGRHAEGNVLGDPQLTAFLETNVVVDVDDFAAAQVDQDVVQMAVAQSDDVANDRSDGAGAGEPPSRRPPLLGVQTAGPQFAGNEIFGRFVHQFGQDSAQDLDGPLAALTGVGAQSLGFQQRREFVVKQLGRARDGCGGRVVFGAGGRGVRGGLSLQPSLVESKERRDAFDPLDETRAGT